MGRQHIGAIRLTIFICLFIIIVCGCYSQTDNGISYIVHNESSQTVFRQVKIPMATFPDLLDNGQWLSNDDASHAHFNDRKAIFVHRANAPLPLLHQLLAGLAALFAMLCAGLFHDSTCQTRELMRIVSYIQAHDGVKWHFSFSRICNK